MKKFIIPIIFGLGLTSCSDFLEREPVEQISIRDQFSTKEGALKALNGVYYSTRSTYFGLANFTYGDLLSGNISFSPRPSGVSAGIEIVPSSVELLYNFSDDPNISQLKLTYSDNYQIINNLNLILENIDSTPDVDESLNKQIKAEALAMRAFIHYQLLKFYAQNYSFTSNASHPGIVYNTRTLVVGVDYPTRNTVSECYSLMENDLTTAISLFQDSPAISVGTSKNFMNINAAKTLAATIALDRQDYAKAISISTDVIENSGIQLAETSSYIQSFSSNESIFEIANTNEDDSYVRNIYNPKTGYSNYVISKDAIDLYTTNDQRLKLITKQSINTIENGATIKKDYYFSKKYVAPVSGLIYRLSELYFIRAEAALKSGNTALASQDINTIRNRAGLSDINSITIDELLMEKRKEFVFENRYFFDLMRNHKNIVRNDGCISNNCNMTYPNDKFVAPIPLESIHVNSLVKQNPGY